jgi:hypothetical protein
MLLFHPNNNNEEEERNHQKHQQKKINLDLKVIIMMVSYFRAIDF